MTVSGLKEAEIKYKSPSIHQTPKYRAKAAYANMLRRCENACGTEPAYAKVKLKMTLDEWLEWAVPRYKKFLDKYPNQVPNVSRKEDKGHYTIGNVEIVSKSVNRASMKEIGQANNGKKRCSTCKTVKAVLEFSKKKTSKDGFDPHCKSCKSKEMKEYNSRPEVKKRRKENRKR